MKEQVTPKEAKQILKATNNKLVDETLNSFVTLRNINKIFPNGVHAVYDFNLELNKNDFVALVGPSGCGKSTTLRMIAGLEEITSGELYINKTYSNYLPSKDRDIAMVFQSYALYPQMTVFDNIAFGLKIRHIDKKEIEERVFKAADILDLGPYLDRKPKELSGGQMQRVALGRAIVRQADLFLMDEPLSNLDAKLRVQMRSEIVRIHKEIGATTIYVTHDQVEALTMANVIVVMNKGFIQQVGSAMDVYNHPANLFVATFIGSPSMNIILGSYKDGMCYFSPQYSFNLGDEFKKKIFDFRLKKINELQEMLEKIDEINYEEILKMESRQIYKRGQDKSNLQIKSKKTNIFTALKEKFTKKGSEQEQDDRAEIKQKITELLKSYQTSSLESIPLKFGIRPEAFYLADSFRGKMKSPIIEAKPSMIELLGNEYIVHFNLFNEDIQIKLENTEEVSNEQIMKIVFDIDKLHIFDVESGLTIR